MKLRRKLLPAAIAPDRIIQVVFVNASAYRAFLLTAASVRLLGRKVSEGRRSEFEFCPRISKC